VFKRITDKLVNDYNERISVLVNEKFQGLKTLKSGSYFVVFNIF